MGAKKQAKRKAPPPALADGMYDQVDTFHKERDLHFADDDGDGGAELDSDEDIEGVMDLSDSDDADSDEDLEAGGKLGKIIAAERALKRQLALQRGIENEEDVDDEDADEDDTRQWGRKKGAYYDAEDVDVDFDSDDELAAEEAEEAQRLEKERAAKLDHAAFGLNDSGTSSGSEDGDEEDEDDGTLGAAARGRDGVRSERIRKDIASMSDSEKEAAVLRDAPELAALLKDLTGSLRDVRQRVGPLLAELRKGGLATAEGLSYLEAKHMLLLMYSIHIMFYMLLKLEGRQVREHPVIQRLVMIKAYLDKIRPIDKRLQGQIDKLVRAAELTASGQALAADEDDPMSFRPNPNALVSRADEDGSDDGIYRPPKLTAMAMDDEPDSRKEVTQQKRRQKAALRRAQQSDYVRELEAELTGAPEELRETGGGSAGDSIALLKERQKLEARARVEEDMMTRVPLSKDERKRLKAQLRAGAGQGLVDDFADDVAGVLDADKDNAIFFDKVRLGQKFGVDLSKDRAVPVSGDADLPGKAGLAERRARYDSLKARQQAQLDAIDAEMRSLKRPRVEDDFYTETKAAVTAKRQAKADKKRVPELHPPVADPVSTEPRAITNEIQKNRGLTPHRRKDIKNPRKHNRVKFASAEKRRKGQVQRVKKPAGPYSGEATGIKSRVSKSTRF